MPTSSISNVTTDPNGNVVPNVTVLISLQPPGGFRISDASEVAPQYSLTSNASGAWSIALERTSNISPSGSFYTVQEQYPASAGGYREYSFTVGAVNATLFASLLTATPPSPTTNYLTQAAGDARYLPIGSGTTNFGMKNIVDFGAVGDGVTNDQPAIQAAINAVTTTGGTVWVPPAQAGQYYKCNSTLTIPAGGIRIVGAGRNISIIRSSAADVFTVGSGSALSFLYLEGVKVQSAAGGGHCFTQAQGLSQMIAFDCFFQQDNSSKSIWDNNNKLFIDNLVLGCRMDMLPTSTTPAWNLAAGVGNINCNTWQGGRCNGSNGATFFKIDTTNAGWQYANHFRDINFEVPTAGCIEAHAVNGFKVENCSVNDLGAPVTTGDMFVIGVGSGGTDSRGVTFDNCRRTGGTLGAGQYDINFAPGTDEIQIRNCRHASSGGYSINMQGAPGNLLIDNNTTLANSSNTNRMLSGGKTLLAGNWGVGGSVSGVTPSTAKGTIPVCDPSGTQFGVIAWSTA